MVRLLYKECTGKILRAYYDVYNGVSHAWPEFIQENALALVLQQAHVPCRQQVEFEVWYKERRVGLQQLDLLVDDTIVVECKVVPELLRIHKAQLYSYLKATGKQVGLLLNFVASEPQFERLFFDPARGVAEESPAVNLPADLPDHLRHPELVSDILGTSIEVHRTLGPGFIHRIYANACHHEFRLRGTAARPRREIQALFRGEEIGTLKFGHFLVEGSVMFFPVAIQDVNDLNVYNFKDWLCYCRADLGIIANFYDTKIRPIFITP